MHFSLNCEIQKDHSTYFQFYCTVQWQWDSKQCPVSMYHDVKIRNFMMQLQQITQKSAHTKQKTDGISYLCFFFFFFSAGTFISFKERKSIFMKKWKIDIWQILVHRQICTQWEHNIWVICNLQMVKNLSGKLAAA